MCVRTISVDAGRVHLELVARVRSGDRQALAELIVKFTPWVTWKAKSLAFRFRLEPEDLVQTGLARLVVCLPGFRPGLSSVLHWACTCCAREMHRVALR